MRHKTTVLDLWAKDSVRRTAELFRLSRDPPTAEQVRAFREERGWSAEQMADDMRTTPLEVSAWEAGTVQVSPYAAARMAWYAEVERWNAAHDEVLRANPPCDWVRENLPGFYEVMFSDPAGFSWSRHHPDARRHYRRCLRCKDMREAVLRMGSPPPEPMGELVDFQGRHDPFLESLPRWLRKPARAVLPLVMAAILVLVVAAQPDRDAGLPATLNGLAHAAIWAAITFTIVSTRLPGLRRRDPGLAGLLAGLAAGVTGVMIWPAYDASVNRLDPRMWIGAAGVAAAAGLIAEARARRNADPEEPAPASLADASADAPALRNPMGDLPQPDPTRAPEAVRRK